MSSWEEALRTLGLQLRAGRLDADLTQQALGVRAGIGGKYVSEIERGTRDVPFSTLHAIVHDGLRLELGIAFGGPFRADRSSGKDPIETLSGAQLAREVIALPARERALVLAIARASIRLARR